MDNAFKPRKATLDDGSAAVLDQASMARDVNMVITWQSFLLSVPTFSIVAYA